MKLEKMGPNNKSYTIEYTSSKSRWIEDPFAQVVIGVSIICSIFFGFLTIVLLLL